MPKPVALVVSFPSNPTAQVCDLDFYRELIAFAKKHHLWVLSDLAYAEIYFDGNPPPSILEVEGAKDVAVEFTSLSKTYAMPGWRMGFAVGNPRLVDALTRIKSYLDYGAFTPVQVAAAAALNGPQDCVAEIRGIYRHRRDVLIDAMGRAGWNIPSPPATMFAWAPVPEPFAGIGSMGFSKILLREAEVAVAPGVGFGEYGEGYRPPRPRRERAPHPPGGARGAEGHAERRRAARQVPRRGGDGRRPRRATFRLRKVSRVRQWKAAPARPQAHVEG